jgi:L-2-hydroxyglutarate oxidase LhgO
MTPLYDIAVVGGGIVGMSFAMQQQWPFRDRDS